MRSTIVLTAVSGSKATRIKQALGGIDGIRVISSHEPTTIVVGTPECIVVFFDPAACSVDASVWPALVDLSLIERPVPLVAYIDAKDVRRTFPLIRHTAVDIVVRGVDDDDNSLRAMVRELCDSTTKLVLARLAGPLSRLPPRLRSLVVEAFRTRAHVVSVDRWFSTAGLPRRSLYRCFVKAGLAAPAQFLSAARVTTACDLFGVTTLSLEQIARRVGYVKRESLSRDLKGLTMLTAQQARRLTPSEIGHRIVRALIKASVPSPDRGVAPEEMLLQAPGLVSSFDAGRRA